MYHYIGNEFIQMMKAINPRMGVASDRKEVYTRCIYCGDSKKNPRSGHLYISVPQTETDLPFYHCKLCQAKGIVTEDFLRDLGCEDINAMVEIGKHNAEVLKLPKYKTLKKIDIYPLNYSYINMNKKNNQAKLNYINNRIGANFTLEDIPKLKLFLNLYDILNANNLPLSRSQYTCNLLDDWFMGFISYDNSYATMRNLCTNPLPDPIGNKRYINYNLVQKDDVKKNYYVIPTQLNLLDPNPIKIHVTEGAFDILSVFYNLNNANIYQNVYIAGGGKSYTQALQFIFEETGIINYEIHLYPDNDVNDGFIYRKILMQMQNLPCDIYIHRNMFEGEKDFGVPMKRIKDYIKRV